MKLQIQGQRLRFRIDELELAQLLAGEPLIEQTVLSTEQICRRELRLHAAPLPELAWTTNAITLKLPQEAVRSYVASLPRRDAHRFTLGEGEAALHLDFEVDVRDSVRVRRAYKSGSNASES